MAEVSPLPSGRGRGPRRSRGKVRGPRLKDSVARPELALSLATPPHFPLLAQWAPPLLEGRGERTTSVEATALEKRGVGRQAEKVLADRLEMDLAALDLLRDGVDVAKAPLE